MKTVFAHRYNRLAPEGLRNLMPMFLAALTLFIGMPNLAFAQATTLGEVMCSVQQNIAPFAGLFNGVAYIAGGSFIGKGLFLLMRHHEDSRNTPLRNPLMHMIGGSALLAFPAFINFIIQSVGLAGDGGGGMPLCFGLVALPGFGAGVGLDVLMENLLNNIRDPLTVLVSIVAIVIGVIMIFQGLVKASNYGYDAKNVKISHILANLIIGAILVVVGQSLSVMLQTLFGVNGIESSYAVQNWAFFGGMAAYDPSTVRFQYAVMAALTFVQLVGMIAFVRGWIIIKDSIEGTGQAKMAQGLTHVIGGAFAINIFYFLEMMDSTFGTGFL